MIGLNGQMTQPFAFPIILLAAGQSRRMRGRDKLLEQVDGQPLLRRQAVMARAVTRASVIVALPPRPHPRHEALDGVQITALPVADAARGLNASLSAAVRALPADAPCAMLILADLPDLTETDLCKVADAVDLAGQTRIWRGATQDGTPGHPIIFKAELFAALAALAGDNGGREVVAEHQAQTQLVPLPGNRARQDLDTPEQWTAWRKARNLPD